MLNVDEVKSKLGMVSSSFCLAKWTTVTFHLESGTAHSCHHPRVHLIPLDELATNSAALHNPSFKIEQRKKMIEGVRPSECDYCWNIEDIGPKEVSDRVIKSSAPYSMGELDNIVNDPYSRTYKPKYVEVSFSHACQFKCSYCSANFSTSWEEEIKKFGEYPTLSGTKHEPTFAEDDNPYVKAFWQWWPEMKKGLHTFRITGGEPLLSPSTFKVMENLLAEPEPSLLMAVNSNLGAPAVLVDKFIHLAAELIQKKAVSNLEVYTSIDAFGERAEYIRNGLKHEVFWANVEKLLYANSRLRIVIMCTFNALSITSFTQLLDHLREINARHRNPERPTSVEIDISYLRHPEYQTVQVLPESYIAQMQQIVDFIERHRMKYMPNNVGFHEMHIYKTRRILEWMKKPRDPQVVDHHRKNFYRFFSEHDRRRNTNFLRTFPEMEKFWDQCRNLSELNERAE